MHSMSRFTAAEQPQPPPPLALALTLTLRPGAHAPSAARGRRAALVEDRLKPLEFVWLGEKRRPQLQRRWLVPRRASGSGGVRAAGFPGGRMDDR